MDPQRKSPEHTGTEHKFDIKIERPPSKPDVWDELLSILEKILDFCVCCITCGCYKRERNGIVTDEYGMILLDNEKQAVQNLLQYLEKDEKAEPVLSSEHIRALSILTYSDNAELQRSAALCTLEISERWRTDLTVALGRPLVELLRSSDTQVQKAATLATSNFCLSGAESNKEILMRLGVVDPLVDLLNSKNVEVQCNTCGCITALATTDANKHSIVSCNAVKPLLRLMRSMDLRVKRNATGAILNLTHIQSNRNELVNQGTIPILVELIHMSDYDIQYYSAAALSNLAVNPKHRAMMIAVGHSDVVRQLVKLLSSKKDRVKCQACFALRNLASDDENQLLAVETGALAPLHHILTSCRSETLAAAAACLRNLSIHKLNEAPFIHENLVPDLCHVVCDSSNPEAQKHIAGTLRNLAVSQYVRTLIENDCVEALTFVLLDLESRIPVLSEVTAALAVMADEDDVKYKLLHLQGGKAFSKLVTLASLSSHREIQYNSAGTLGQLALVSLPEDLKEANKKGIVLYIDKFLKSPDPSFVHVALWTLNMLLKDLFFLRAFTDHSIESVIDQVQTTHQLTKIQELSTSVIDKLHGVMASSSSSED